MCIKIQKKSFLLLQKQRTKFFFFLFVTKLTYGKNLSDNENQLLFSICYSVFGIDIGKSEFLNGTTCIQYSVYFNKTNYLVFVKFTKTNIFGIQSIFTIRCNSGGDQLKVHEYV